MNEDILKENYFVAAIDGIQCPTIQSFLVEIGRAFSFPDYYGKNLDALNDCITDLDWIPKENYTLIINNSESFLNANEEDRNRVTKLLEEVAEGWRNVPNFEGEDWRVKSDFQIIFN